MDDLLKILMNSMWVQPFALLGFFAFLEERVRKAGFSERIKTIDQLKIRHNKINSKGTKCVTALSNIIKDQKSNEILKLYYTDYPSIQVCLCSLQVRRLALYIALAVVLLLLQYLLSQVPATTLSQEKTNTIKTWFSCVGLLCLFSYIAYLWFRRYTRIIIFCDQINKLEGE